MMRWVYGVMVCVTLSLLGLAGGCASGPKYVEPQLSQQDAATIKATGNVFLGTIDSADYGGRRSYGLVLGMNIADEPKPVKATPGRHEIVAVYATGNGQTRYRMVLELEKGKAYEITHPAAFSNRLMVQNLTTGKKWYLDPDAQAYVDEQGKTSPQSLTLKP